MMEARDLPKAHSKLGARARVRSRQKRGLLLLLLRYSSPDNQVSCPGIQGSI